MAAEVSPGAEVLPERVGQSCEAHSVPHASPHLGVGPPAGSPVTAAPLQQSMPGDGDVESSYTEVVKSKFAQLIRKGCFQFIKGKYFEDCWSKRTPIQMRQQIPPEYLWDGNEVVELWRKHKCKFMIAISYAWLSAEHPDPALFHLQRLVKVFAAFKRRSGRSGNKLECAVFIDWCSLWQKLLVDGIDSRTPAQLNQFKQGLSEINTPYGHLFITCARLEEVPAGMVRTYHLRGWTEFERTIIDSKAAARDHLVTTVVLEGADGPHQEGRFDVNCSDREMDKLFEPGKNFKGPPVTPARFNRNLQRLEEKAKDKGVNLFTNGMQDMELVKKKYAVEFRHRPHLVLDSSLDWS